MGYSSLAPGSIRLAMPAPELDLQRLPTRAPAELESVLRSPAQRIVLLVGAVVLAALLMTAHISDLNTAMRNPQPGLRVFAHQLLLWSLWGIAGVLLVRFARGLRARWHSWLPFFALQIPLSIGVATAFADTYDRTAEWIYVEPPARPFPRPPRPEFGRPPPPEDMRPDDPIPGGALVPPTPGTPAAAAHRGFPVRLRFNLAIYWIVLGIGAGIDAFLRAGDRERLAAQLHAELSTAQLSALRDQLHPHFFFNSLHTVAGLIREKRDAEALKVLAALGDLLRTTLDQRGTQEVSLREELRVTERYLDIERVRFGSRLDVAIDVDPSLLELRVPSLLLQPLVENAVRYAIEPRTEGGRIRVSARREGEHLLLEVRDDGPGFPAWVLRGGEAPLTDHRSIGLANDRERLLLLYGEQHAFELANAAGGGALVRIRLPEKRVG